MSAKGLATLLATLAVAAGLMAVARVFVVFTANVGRVPGWGGLWMVPPIGLGLAAIPGVRGTSVATVWSLIGGVWGFVILGAWSLGPFFAMEGLVLLAAGLVHLLVVGPKWRLLLAPVWLLAGSSAVAFVFLLRDLVYNSMSRSGSVTHAPVVVFGSWLFAGTLVFLSACHLTPVAWRAFRSRG